MARAGSRRLYEQRGGSDPMLLILYYCVGSMQRQMEEEMARAGVRRQYEQRQGIVQEALNSTLENDRAVEAVLTSNGQRQVGTH